MDTSCEFCNEWAGGAKNTFRLNFSLEELPSRILVKTDHFYVLVGLGALREGYHLVLPNQHIRSFGHMADTNYFLELALILQKTRNICENHYQLPFIFFEHGGFSDDKPGGSCLDHAHIHGIPLHQRITDLLDTKFNCYQIDDLDGLQKPIENQRPYLFVEDQSVRRFIYSIPDNLPSQYLRRVWAGLIGENDRWDWGVDLGKKNVIKTYRKLYPYFQREFGLK